jgi:hypothetical protein
MTQSLTLPTRRIALAIALSVLVHGLVLWLPKIKLPEHEVQLHSLTAKLIPLPKVSGKIAAHKHKARPLPEPVVQSPPEQPVAASEPLAASEPAAASSPIAVNEPAAASAPLAASEPVVAEPAASGPVAADVEPQRPPLPKHAQLRFSIYHGEKGLKMGESVQTLEINDGRYILKADVHTTGVVRMFKSYHIEQTSTGAATEQTLQPETFVEDITDGNGKTSNRANFDWVNHTIRFSNGSEAKLPMQAQDILSILYQFPPMRKQEERVSINVGTGKKFETFRFEIAFEESLETAMGTLQTVHFRKLHAANEEGLEIWFAQEYRLLPAKVRHIDRDGKIDAEAIITDIRVSDE